MFTKLLSPQSLARLQDISNEILQSMNRSDAELGTALLEYAREGQEVHPYPATPWTYTYTTSFFWHLVPELAFRLNPSLELTEREKRAEIEKFPSNYDFRITLGYYLKNLPCTTASKGMELLTREACNGNLVVLGIDRLCPGVLGDTKDPLTMELTSIARTRRTKFEGTWTPEILNRHTERAAEMA